MHSLFAHSMQSTAVLGVLFFFAFMAGRYAGNHVHAGPLRYLAGGSVSAVVFLGGFFALHSVMPGL